jgi:protein TonB
VSVTAVDSYGQQHARDTALWTFAAVVVAALHVGLVAAYLLFRAAPGDRAEAPVIDVAFMPAANTPARAAPEAQPAEPTPPVEQSDLAPPKEEPDTPRQAVIEPEPPQEKTEPAPQPEPMPPPVALTTPAPTLPEEPAVTAPPLKHAEPLPQASKPVTIPERAKHKPVTDDKAVEAKRQAAPPRPAESAASRPARMASAPNPGADSEGARAGRASWESELAALRNIFSQWQQGQRHRAGRRDHRSQRTAAVAPARRQLRLVRARQCGDDRHRARTALSTLSSRNEPDPDSAHDSTAPEAAMNGAPAISDAVSSEHA